MNNPSKAWDGEQVRKWLERRFEASRLDQAAADTIQHRGHANAPVIGKPYGRKQLEPLLVSLGFKGQS